MTDDVSFHLDEETLQKMIEKKQEMGFGEKDWGDWFKALFGKHGSCSASEVIENTLQKVHFETYYDMWIQNFSTNLNEIWKGNSARELMENKKSNVHSVVIGRGPSLKKYDHLEMLSKSKFNGNIICTDGSLIDTLKSGVTPDVFKDFFVVTIDSMDDIFHHYDDPIVDKYGSKIKGIFSTTISPKVLERAKKADISSFWIQTLFDFDKGKSSFNYISNVMTKTKNYNKGLPAIQTGGNVGTSSWLVAWAILKSSNVILIGFDQGYSPDVPLEQLGYGGHKFPSGMSIKLKVLERAYPLIFNPEFNCYVRQDPMFQYYSNALKEFVNMALQKKGIKTINATEGGALFGPGFECMKFRDFLTKFD